MRTRVVDANARRASGWCASREVEARAMGRGRTSRREALRSIGAVARSRNARAMRGVEGGGGGRNARLECDAFGFERERGRRGGGSRRVGAMAVAGWKPQARGERRGDALVRVICAE